MDVRYINYQNRKQHDHNNLCRRCGACCGADWDPCINLAKEDSGKYFCIVYENRLGQQKTVSGSEFTCVEIRDHVNKGYFIPGCAYFEKDDAITI